MFDVLWSFSSIWIACWNFSCSEVFAFLGMSSNIKNKGYGKVISTIPNELQLSKMAFIFTKPKSDWMRKDGLLALLRNTTVYPHSNKRKLALLKEITTQFRKSGKSRRKLEFHTDALQHDVKEKSCGPMSSPSHEHSSLCNRESTGASVTKAVLRSTPLSVTSSSSDSSLGNLETDTQSCGHVSSSSHEHSSSCDEEPTGASVTKAVLCSTPLSVASSSSYSSLGNLETDTQSCGPVSSPSFENSSLCDGEFEATSESELQDSSELLDSVCRTSPDNVLLSDEEVSDMDSSSQTVVPDETMFKGKIIIQSHTVGYMIGNGKIFIESLPLLNMCDLLQSVKINGYRLLDKLLINSWLVNPKACFIMKADARRERTHIWVKAFWKSLKAHGQETRLGESGCAMKLFKLWKPLLSIIIINVSHCT